MKGMELPILVYENSNYELEKLGIETSATDTKIVQFTFYNIDMIYQYEDDGVQLTAIYCGGKDYTSPAPFDLIRKLINENL
jgi:hypothetical protein